MHVLEAVSAADIIAALRRALAEGERGLGELQLQIGDEALGDDRAGAPMATCAAR